MELEYPKNSWSHIYTDGSAMNVTSDGGEGVVLKLIHNETVIKAIRRENS
jgi:ribonuclease HI